MTVTDVPLKRELGAPKLGVLLVDDVASTRHLLRAVLGTVHALEVIDEAGTGRAAIESAARLQPDIILLDLALPDTDGALILEQLLSVAPNTQVIILSDDAKEAGPALVARGAIGSIEKGLAPRELICRLSSALNTPLPVTGLLASDMNRTFGRY